MIFFLSLFIADENCITRYVISNQIGRDGWRIQHKVNELTAYKRVYASVIFGHPSSCPRAGSSNANHLLRTEDVANLESLCETSKAVAIIPNHPVLHETEMIVFKSRYSLTY